MIAGLFTRTAVCQEWVQTDENHQEMQRVIVRRKPEKNAFTAVSSFTRKANHLSRMSPDSNPDFSSDVANYGYKGEYEGVSY